MRKARIENGVVVNVAKFDPESLPEWADSWIDVPGDVSAGDLFDGKAFTKPVVVGTVEQIKAEAGRRIEAIMPPYKQRNFLALQAELSMTHGPDPQGWPADMQSLAQEGLAAWARIKAIRSRSDEIETMDPIPADFTADKYWP